jgi:hypothetical protein
VAKFRPDGELEWSTVIGGPEAEEAYGLEIDSKGYVIVHGRGARGTPVTPGTYQPEFKGCGGGDPGNPHTTAQNAYICKLTPDGSAMVWGSFFGIDHLHRDLALDANDDIYTTWGVRPKHADMAYWDTWMKPEWVSNAFQKVPQGGDDTGACKISGDGSNVIWATYIGGSDYDSIEASIDVDPQGNVYVGTQTRSPDVPTTEGAADRTHNGGVDWYVCKLSPDGSQLLYGTYIGDEGGNFLNTHNLVVNEKGECFSSTCATSAAFPTTPGAVQTNYGGGRTDWGIVKLTRSGGLAAAALIGGNGYDNPDGIRIDADGNLVLFGQGNSTNFPVTADALQPGSDGDDEALVMVLTPDLARMVYATCYGGPNNDAGRAGCVAADGSLIIAGAQNGGGLPVTNAWQGNANGPGDALVVRLKRSDTD